jgi:hypothetical protein
MCISIDSGHQEQEWPLCVLVKSAHDVVSEERRAAYLYRDSTNEEEARLRSSSEIEACPAHRRLGVGGYCMLYCFLCVV